MDTGKRMKLRRLELGLKADDIAEIVGCSRSTIYRYENGDIEKVPVNSIDSIAEVLQTTPAYLMGWTDDPIDYDNLDIYVPKEFRDIGFSNEDYYKFKQAESRDSLESSIESHIEEQIIEYVSKLNTEGKLQALSQVENLTYNPKYLLTKS